MPSRRLLSTAVALTLATSAIAQDCPPAGTCQSFGVDFVNGGSYFQNSLSTDPFTAVEEFEGCQNDTANNIFVDPNGDQYQCTDTPMTPDDTPETVTCPLDKDQLFSGEWSMIVISNNGDCDPIAYQRDFSLSVGPQQTLSVPPTITVSTVFTPVESDTITSTQSITSTAKPITSTVPLINFNPTITIQPLPAITIFTKALLTLTSTEQIPDVVATATAITTPSCDLPQRRLIADPLASIVVTILSDLGLKDRAAEPTPVARSPSLEFKRAIIEGRAVSPEVKAKYVQERHERLALQKRAPDEPTLTVTDATLPASTITDSLTAPTTTITGTTTQIITITTTPVITVKKGIAASIATITASKKTITNTFWIPATVLEVTKTTAITLTITETSTPAALAASCSKAGGTLA